MKQCTVAEKAGISDNYISNIENGKSIPSLQSFSNICIALSTTPDYFLLGTIRTDDVPKVLIDNLKLCNDEAIEMINDMVPKSDDKSPILMYNTHRKGGIAVLKILICDDDKQIINQVQSLINKIEKEKNIEFSIDSHTNADFILHENICYDIAITDIEMPGISGLKLSKKLKELNPDVIVIILTSFSDYLDQAMKINVFRYLSKPIDINRFNKNFLEAINYYKHISKEIVIKNYDEIYRIKTREILYIENKKHGSFIVTEKHKFTTNRKPLEWLEIINQPNCFVFSHKSFVVNLQNIINFNRNVITFKTYNGPLEVNCISQRKYLEFKKSFFDFAGGI